MASSHASLDAAAAERKARLAKLKSLKRKEPSTDAADDAKPSESTQAKDPQPSQDKQQSKSSPAAATLAPYISGRNYDLDAQGPRLGFDAAPSEGRDTLEKRAEVVAQEVRETAAKEAAEDEKPLDLFALQPRKPNWDLKRDLQRKLDRLNVQTDNAIARLVRERVQAQKARQSQQASNTKESRNGESRQTDDDDEAATNLGLEGSELVEGVHQREREDADDERREREALEELG